MPTIFKSPWKRITSQKEQRIGEIFFMSGKDFIIKVYKGKRTNEVADLVEMAPLLRKELCLLYGIVYCNYTTIEPMNKDRIRDVLLQSGAIQLQNGNIINVELN